MLMTYYTPLGKIRAAIAVVKTNLIHFVHADLSNDRELVTLQGGRTR